MKEKSHPVREKFSALGLMIAVIGITIAIVMICAQLGIDLGVIGTN